MNSTLIFLVDLSLIHYHVIISILYALAAILAVSLNLLVGVAIVKNPSLWKPSMFLLGNLVATDFLTGLIVHPFMAVLNIIVSKITYETYKKLVFIARNLFLCAGSVSLCTVAAISVDRLLALKLKTSYRVVITKRKVGLVLLVIWIGIIAGVIVKFVDVKLSVQLDGIFLTVGAASLLLIIVVCYSLGFYILSKSSRRMVAHEQENHPDPRTTPTDGQPTSFNFASYRRSFFTMFIIFVILLVSYFPYFCSVFASLVFYDQSSSSGQRVLYVAFTFSEVVVAFNSAMNPIFYLLRMQDIRSTAKTVLKKTFS